MLKIKMVLIDLSRVMELTKERRDLEIHEDSLDLSENFSEAIKNAKKPGCQLE